MIVLVRCVLFVLLNLPRLHLTSGLLSQDDSIVGAKDQVVVDKIKALDERISGLVAEISELGSSGQVEEAQVSGHARH